MTRSEHYNAGKAEGERWADEDERSALGRMADTLANTRAEATLAVEARSLGRAHDSQAAFLLGRARGYRQVART